jgi:hypothetical protein
MIEQRQMIGEGQKMLRGPVVKEADDGERGKRADDRERAESRERARYQENGQKTGKGPNEVDRVI